MGSKGQAAQLLLVQYAAASRTAMATKRARPAQQVHWCNVHCAVPSLLELARPGMGLKLTFNCSTVSPVMGSGSPMSALSLAGRGPWWNLSLAAEQRNASSASAMRGCILLRTLPLRQRRRQRQRTTDREDRTGKLRRTSGVPSL